MRAACPFIVVVIVVVVRLVFHSRHITPSVEDSRSYSWKKSIRELVLADE